MEAYGWGTFTGSRGGWLRKSFLLEVMPSFGHKGWAAAEEVWGGDESSWSLDSCQGNRTRTHKACPDMEITGLVKFASISSPLAWDLDDYEASELKPHSSFPIKRSFTVLLSVLSSQETLCLLHSWNMPLWCSEALLFTAKYDGF